MRRPKVELLSPNRIIFYAEEAEEVVIFYWNDGEVTLATNGPYAQAYIRPLKHYAYELLMALRRGIQQANERRSAKRKHELAMAFASDPQRKLPL